MQRRVLSRLNERQLKVLNRLIDYELRGGFEGGMNNDKYQKMTEIGDRTALRDLNDLEERGLTERVGHLVGQCLNAELHSSACKYQRIAAPFMQIALQNEEGAKVLELIVEEMTRCDE